MIHNEAAFEYNAIDAHSSKTGFTLGEIRACLSELFIS
jgi:hypothetical protein